MPILTSKFKKGLDNLGVDIAKVKKLKRGIDNPQKPYLSILYFYGLDEANQEKVIRTWFYKCKDHREQEVCRIREKYPKLIID